MDIVINKISKRFGDKQVIEDFSEVIREKAITCIMGPSGCGKTTILYMLMGLMVPDIGTITGVPDTKSAVFQEDRLCETLNAVANVKMVCRKEVTRKTIEEHLSEIGLQGSLLLPVSQLSGGMRRRVAVVRAMLAESDILFMDEPFKGLDAEMKREVIRFVKKHMDDRTVVLVTHDEEEAREMGGYMIRMKSVIAQEIL
jgi:NitT/TauT family transport system ATP-binding protein